MCIITFIIFKRAINTISPISRNSSFSLNYEFVKVNDFITFCSLEPYVVGWFHEFLIRMIGVCDVYLLFFFLTYRKCDVSNIVGIPRRSRDSFVKEIYKYLCTVFFYEKQTKLYIIINRERFFGCASVETLNRRYRIRGRTFLWR